MSIITSDLRKRRKKQWRPFGANVPEIEKQTEDIIEIALNYLKIISEKGITNYNCTFQRVKLNHVTTM